MELLIDTTKSLVRIGLADEEGAIVAEEQWEAQKRLGRDLASRIQTLLARQGKTFSDIKRIRVHTGPGRFTTLRVGIVVANILGYALEIPLVGVTGEFNTLSELISISSAKEDSDSVSPQYQYPPDIHHVDKLE